MNFLGISVRGKCHFFLNLSPKWALIQCTVSNTPRFSLKKKEQERRIFVFSSIYSLKRQGMVVHVVADVLPDCSTAGYVSTWARDCVWPSRAIAGLWLLVPVVHNSPKSQGRFFPAVALVTLHPSEDLGAVLGPEHAGSPHLPEQHQDEIIHQGELIILPEEPETCTMYTCLFTLCFSSISC